MRSVADVNAEYAAKIAEAELKQKLKGIERQSERREQQEREERRAAREAKHAEQIQMLRIAGRELASQFEVVSNGEIDTDWIGLEAELRAQRLWPPFRSDLQPADESIPEAKAENDVPAATLSEPFSVKDYYTAAEIAAITGWPVRTVRNRMSVTYKGQHPIKVARKQGSRGERLVTHNEMQRLLTMSGNGDLEVPAITRQDADVSVGNAIAVAAAE